MLGALMGGGGMKDDFYRQGKKSGLLKIEEEGDFVEI
jgi:hypothetical protein